MNLIQRQIIAGIGLSLIIVIVMAASFFIAFPLHEWTLLWERKLLDVPFILFIVALSILIGLIFGFANAHKSKKQLQSIDTALQQVEQGRKIEVNADTSIYEIELIWNKITKIQKLMNEQIKQSQKLANEKAEDQQKQMQEIVSQERNRLARELHDSVSQQLFAASMLMSAVTEGRDDTGNDNESRQLKLIEETIQQSQLEMRALLLHLRPAALKGKSLQEGIQELLSELSQKVPMDIQCKVEPMNLDKGIEDHLFRILQESVSNTLRHAKATSLEVLLIARDDFIILRVSDDGVGFDTGKDSNSGSYGIQNMYERAVEIGGTLKIVSLKNQGTRLEVKVPKVLFEGENND